MRSLISSLSNANKALWRAIQAVAMDIDGTLTSQGTFPAEVVKALYELRSSGLKLVLVTGRPSGWVQALASYLPVDAAIAENGGVVFLGRESAPFVRNPIDATFTHTGAADFRPPLKTMFESLLNKYPFLEITEDNVYRLSDYTFKVKDLSSEMLLKMKTIVESCGLAFTWSTIHAHIMPQGQQKGATLQWLLQQWNMSSHPAHTTLTVGDSPNDVTLFDNQRFPCSAGVANILKYRALMPNFPQVISGGLEGDGFVEIAQTLLQLRSEKP
ncbi:HAD family phosphatase [bacterium]|nr:HAD family phosphatase [bacterium]